MLGEVRTGLLLSSTAASQFLATEILSLAWGQRVLRSERPISYAASPELFTGVDCALPTISGSGARGIGTVVSHAAVTGGRVLQGLAHVRVVDGRTARRRPWSHYLARPGVVELGGEADLEDLAGGFVTSGPAAHDLDLRAVSDRTMNAVQASNALDRRPPFRAARAWLCWALADARGVQAPAVLMLRTSSGRALRLSAPLLATDAGDALDWSGVVELCRDLALHDWLVTVLATFTDRIEAGRAPAGAADRWRPAVTLLMNLWQPGARLGGPLAEVGREARRRLGLSEQWSGELDRLPAPLPNSPEYIPDDR